MGNRPSCRSCRHCTPAAGVEMGWCQLRRLAIHPELAGEVWCHHWMATAGRLPLVAGNEPDERGRRDHQLALAEFLT